MNPVRLADANTEFKNFLKEKGHSGSTIVAYVKDIDQLIEFLKDLEKHHVQDVKKEDIEAFLGKLSTEGYTPKSISRKINSTRTFYRFLKINEYVTDDPSLLVEHPKYQLAPPRILTPTEYRALRDAARNDARMSAIIELLLQTGIRIGELTNLRLSDVGKDSLNIKPFEKHPERTVSLNKRAKESLGRYMEVRPKVNEDHLFITKSGKPFLIRNIRTSVERYFRLAEIKNAKVNDLRHTFVAHHLKHGVSLVLLSKMLGHKRLSTTERYLEYVPDRAAESQVLSEL
ncbi:MAG: tyrosine-type recombinase/integrase [Candidatus Levybacteria bacterium]|nr:tyrosine-type recombinase/integrase [Candidatus Levybacteria bacterium]MBI2420800.1 tyrosine-type recombinase/integrase [Candidatus Levybacteria bacterium]MBI4098242.1 tyrosine-type recombinase/integrase [Candidatus Levybacteria bacterium]